MRDFKQFLVDVHNWTLVYLFAVKMVYHGRYPNDDSPDQNGPVHGLRSDGLRCREEGHNEGECDIQKRDDVERNGKFAQRKSAWREWLAPETLEKNTADGDEVAGEERGDEQADDGVESGRGTNVDQSETNGDGEGEKNSVQWNFSSYIDR